jgi:hypothetical protein
MEVFLVPVGPDRYEPYCEVPDEPTDPDDPHAGPPSRFRRLKRYFSDMLAEAERERRHGRSDAQAQGWLAKGKAQIMRWVAESVAEQRLLWTLRRQTDATFLYPNDMPEADAVAVLRKQLKRDFDKHQFWLIIDSIGFIASGALMLVPGPNVLAYYFAFRLVGHYFSLRGARQGLHIVAWTNTGSAPLAELRSMLDVAPEQRAQRVQDVAGTLRLEHLATFFQRSAIPSA